MNKKLLKTIMIVSLSISGLLLVFNLQSVTIAMATIGGESKVNDSTYQVIRANAEKELAAGGGPTFPSPACPCRPHPRSGAPL